MTSKSLSAVVPNPLRYNDRLRAPFKGREKFARRLRLAPGAASNLPRIGYVSTANFLSARGRHVDIALNSEQVIVFRREV